MKRLLCPARGFSLNFRRNSAVVSVFGPGGDVPCWDRGAGCSGDQRPGLSGGKRVGCGAVPPTCGAAIPWECQLTLLHSSGIWEIRPGWGSGVGTVADSRGYTSPSRTPVSCPHFCSGAEVEQRDSLVCLSILWTRLFHPETQTRGCQFKINDRC